MSDYPARPLKLVDAASLADSDPDLCIGHGGILEADGPDMGIVVGWIDLGTGPGKFLLACHTCVVYYGIMRLAEHPANTDCLPRFHDDGGPR